MEVLPGQGAAERLIVSGGPDSDPAPPLSEENEVKKSIGARRLENLLQWYTEKFPTVFPSIAKLAEHLDVCSRTVKRWIAELKEYGSLKVQHHGPRGAVYCYKNVPDCPDVPVPVPDYVPDPASHLYISSGVLEFPPTPKAQSAPEPGPSWPTMTTDYFTGQRRPVETPRVPIPSEDRQTYFELHRAFPMLSHGGLLQAVEEKKLELQRKPPASEYSSEVLRKDVAG